MYTLYRDEISHHDTDISIVLEKQESRAVTCFTKRSTANRAILEHLLDIVLLLAKQNLAFQGHREHSCEADKGWKFFRSCKIIEQI